MFEKIMVPLDGSPFAERAVGAAREMARAFGGKIMLVTVLTPPQVVPGEWMAETADLHVTLQEKALAKSEAYLHEMRDSLLAEGFEVEALIATGAPVAEEILGLIDHLGADLVVMSTHGRSGVQRWIFGSVAERVLRHTAVPILLVRPDHAE